MKSLEVLAGEAPVGVAREQIFADELLGLSVGIGDEVGGSLDADLEVAESREVAERQSARFACDSDHVGEHRIVVHGLASSSATLSARRRCTMGSV